MLRYHLVLLLSVTLGLCIAVLSLANGLKYVTIDGQFVNLLPVMPAALLPKRHSVGSEECDPTDALPRPKRRTRRDKTDRGLPADEELQRLAAAYLERQRKHWPEFAAAGFLPEPSDGVIAGMVDDFKARHRTGRVTLDAVKPLTRFRCKLGGSYSRYSCDNSSPTSVLDQMCNTLDKAKLEGLFIPWQYVFADYSITGLDASRQGYTSYKSLLATKEHFVDTTFIDDFTRASRDALEWWKLAALSRRLNKRLIGASDGFDLSNPNSDVLITVYGLVSKLFIKSLRDKVGRGMKGAARRGTCVGKPSLGFTRRPHCDAQGNVVRRPDGLPRYELCIDPLTREHRLLIYRLFVEQGLSAYKIARRFNEQVIDGSTSWTDTGIKRLLWNPDAVGIFIWNRRCKQFDDEGGRWITIERPRNEWVVKKRRHLALVPAQLWVAARRRLLALRRASPLTGKMPSRNQRCATTLFSGTLFCDCGKELTLGRSAGDHKFMCCTNGLREIHGCKLSTSKSTRIIEDCLLGYIRNTLLTETMIKDLVDRANVFLTEETRKPQVDIAPLDARLRDIESKIKKLVQRVEADQDESLCDGYHNRIKELQRTANQLKRDIHEAERQSQPPPAPLDLERVTTYLTDLRAVLNQAIPRAAEAIRELTGPITIRHERIPGRARGARWIARFSPDVLRLLQQAARRNRYPDAATLTAVTTGTQAIEVVIEKIPEYELQAPVLRQLFEQGTSITQLAATYHISGTYAKQLLEFARTGTRPWRGRKRKPQIDGHGPAAEGQSI